VVTIDDIIDVIREEATEDILKMAGAGEMLFETRSFWTSLRNRMPWLLAAAIGGVLVAVALSGFEGALAAVPILALFMPVIAGMGGNVGTQSSTIVVRGLAVGYVESASLGRLVVREMSLGLMLGAIYGVLIAVVAPFIGSSVEDPLALGAVLTLGMMGSMTIAATVGTSIPLLMNRFKIDPAVSTGPFVTTAVDILGLMFYFWLATVLLGVPA
jgi:magnesium transporter